MSTLSPTTRLKRNTKVRFNLPEPTKHGPTGVPLFVNPATNMPYQIETPERYQNKTILVVRHDLERNLLTVKAPGEISRLHSSFSAWPTQFFEVVTDED